MKSVLVTTLLLIISHGCVEACRCAQRHPQRHYCESDFTISVKVKKDAEKINDNTIKYDVDIDYTYKATNDAEDILENEELYTTSSSASCGVILEKGKAYVVTGSVSDGKARINSCGFIRLATDVTPTQKKGFKCSYKKGCKCTICREIECDTKNKDKNCVMPSNKEECFIDHTVCVNRDGICDWTKCAGFSGCINP